MPIEKIRSLIFRITKFGILLMIPLVLLFLGFFITMLITIRGREVLVPNLVGLEYQEAEQILNRNHLQASIKTRRYDDHAPPGLVISQMPEANTRVKMNKQIHLTISEGKRKAVVPNLRGLSLKEAIMVLTRSGLRVGMVSRASLLGTASESIVQQAPAAGTTDLSSPYVNLLVNAPAPPPRFLMPSLAGLRAADVVPFFENAGFRMSPAEHVFNPSSATGEIVSHYPKAGYPFDRNTPVTLVVNR